MGDKGLDFKHKEVVNITDGKRLGYVLENHIPAFIVAVLDTDNSILYFYEFIE